MKALKLIFVGISLFFFGNALGETKKEDPAQIKVKIEGCKKLIAEHCGSSSFEECSKKKDKKTGQVGACVSFLATHRKMFDLDDLNPNFQTLLKGIDKPGEDGKECAEVAKKVCGDDVDLPSCMQRNAGSFPSFCRNFASDRIAKMEAAQRNDPQLKSCSTDIMKQCKADLGKDDDNNPKVVLAGLEKYRACLKKAMEKSRVCQDLVKVDKNTPVSKSIQLINGQ